MIVITSINKIPRHVFVGDEFRLVISDATGSEVVISEKITKDKVINFIASIRFALDDGNCEGFHLMGIFANQSELPKEIREAVMFDDLSYEQKINFERTCGVKL